MTALRRSITSSAGGKYAGRNPNDKPQVVLLDLKLPKLDDLDVLRAIRADERTKFLPVVILTSSNEEQDLLAGYSLEANSYVRNRSTFTSSPTPSNNSASIGFSLNEPPPGR